MSNEDWLTFRARLEARARAERAHATRRMWRAVARRFGRLIRTRVGPVRKPTTLIAKRGVS